MCLSKGDFIHTASQTRNTLQFMWPALRVLRMRDCTRNSRPATQVVLVVPSQGPAWIRLNSGFPRLHDFLCPFWRSPSNFVLLINTANVNGSFYGTVDHFAISSDFYWAVEKCRIFFCLAKCCRKIGTHWLGRSVIQAPWVTKHFRSWFLIDRAWAFQ